MTKNELTEFNNQSNKMDYFYKIWTLKEAYLKATSEGITYGMENISVIKLNEELYEIQDPKKHKDDKAWQLKTKNYGRHVISYAIKSEKTISKVREIRVNNLIDMKKITFNST